MDSESIFKFSSRYLFQISFHNFTTIFSLIDNVFFCRVLQLPHYGEMPGLRLKQGFVLFLPMFIE
jgi:hypothetical protein